MQKRLLKCASYVNEIIIVEVKRIANYVTLCFSHMYTGLYFGVSSTWTQYKYLYSPVCSNTHMHSRTDAEEQSDTDKKTVKHY